MWQCQDQELVFGEFDEIGKVEMVFVFFDLCDVVVVFVLGEELVELVIGGVIVGIDENVGCVVDEDDVGVDQEFWFVYYCVIVEFFVGLYYVGQCVVIGNVDCGDVEFVCLMYIGVWI